MAKVELNYESGRRDKQSFHVLSVRLPEDRTVQLSAQSIGEDHYGEVNLKTNLGQPWAGSSRMPTAEEISSFVEEVERKLEASKDFRQKIDGILAISEFFGRSEKREVLYKQQMDKAYGGEGEG